jgi:hypothetical protein
MNERIKELKKQAWEYAMAVHDGHIVPPLDKEVWPIDKVFDEKFAELIVEECAKVAVEAESTGVARLIMIHFGVKE